MKSLIRKIWRLQPLWLRRFEAGIIARLMLQRLNPRRPLLRGDIVVAGFLGTHSGVGTSARQMLHYFQERGMAAHPANLSRFALREDFDAGPLWPAEAQKGGIVILHTNPDMLAFSLRAIGREKILPRRVVGYWAWELEVAPKSWIFSMQAVDEVWACSHFVADALKKAGTDRPVHVVPIVLNVAEIPTAPHSDPLPQFAGRPIVFFMYDVNSSHARKNPEAVIAAFRCATADDPKPVLVIKISNNATWPESLARVQKAAEGMANIHIIQDKLPLDVMQDILARADIIMSLHRSEGFGLLMAEAMAAAKPVIATGWSGNLDFMTRDCSILVDYKLVPVEDPQHMYDKYNAVWAEPDINQAADALMRLLADPRERQRMGAAARLHIATLTSSESWFASLPESLRNDTLY